MRTIKPLNPILGTLGLALAASMTFGVVQSPLAYAATSAATDITVKVLGERPSIIIYSPDEVTQPKLDLQIDFINAKDLTVNLSRLMRNGDIVPVSDFANAGIGVKVNTYVANLEFPDTGAYLIHAQAIGTDGLPIEKNAKIRYRLPGGGSSGGGNTGDTQNGQTDPNNPGANPTDPNTQNDPNNQGNQNNQNQQDGAPNNNQNQNGNTANDGGTGKHNADPEGFEYFGGNAKNRNDAKDLKEDNPYFDPVAEISLDPGDSKLEFIIEDTSGNRMIKKPFIYINNNSTKKNNIKVTIPFANYGLGDGRYIIKMIRHNKTTGAKTEILKKIAYKRPNAPTTPNTGVFTVAGVPVSQNDLAITGVVSLLLVSGLAYFILSRRTPAKSH